MHVRIWGELEDRLIEVRVEPPSGAMGMRIAGLPEDRARTTADRIRAALLNSGLVEEIPTVSVRLHPSIAGPATSRLDVAIALAVLYGAGSLGSGFRWLLASGRLGLDGSVHGPDPTLRTTLEEVVGSVCRTPLLRSERMFEEDER